MIDDVQTKVEIDYEQRLADDIMQFRHDPLGYVLYAFPWGEPDTELVNKKGPRKWQVEYLEMVGKRLRGEQVEDVISEAIQTAIASGHGIGKSALVSWLILWGLSTCVDTNIVCTANTESQLRTKTWPELAKWHRLSINKDWFDFTATSLASTDANHSKTWRADSIPWSERNPEAFAGLHNEGKRIIVVFDEASSIPDLIWETTEGALTDENTEIIWAVFGNPTKNDGRFSEAFKKFRHRWQGKQIDSRTVDGTNKKQIDKWIDDWGVDSDFVKVRVLGQFPAQSASQFISGTAINAAVEREIPVDMDSPMIYAIDFARSGNDMTVMRGRRGRDARTYPIYRFREANSMKLTAQIMDKLSFLNKDPVTKVDQLFGDGGGIGGPIIDRLNQLGARCVEVGFGTEAQDKSRFANKRAEMWSDMRDWLETGCIDGSQHIIDDLGGVQYGDDKRDRLLLESKKDMKARGLSSPDDADALCMTFAFPVLASAIADMAEDGDEIESDFDVDDY